MLTSIQFYFFATDLLLRVSQIVCTIFSKHCLVKARIHLVFEKTVQTSCLVVNISIQKLSRTWVPLLCQVN